MANTSSSFRFPIGGHVVTSLWAHTWGKVRPQLRNASNEIVVIGAPMFARHGQSYLWTAATTNGSVVLTWENFFLGNPYERLATNLHESARILIRENSCQFVDKTLTGEKPTALNTEGFEERRRGEEEEFLDRIDKIDRIVDANDPSLSVNPVNPVRKTPCLSNSVSSRPLVRPSGSPSAKVPSETLCVSAAHVFSAAGISAREGIRENPCQSVDLQSLPLPFREIATSKYALYVCQCFKIMGRCGIPTREAMEFFFQGLANYRDSCEDPSLAMPPREGENPEDVRVRQASARILKEDYAARMSIFEQVWLPNLSRYLPPELHDEFRRRLKAFSSSPSLPEERLGARNAFAR